MNHSYPMIISTTRSPIMDRLGFPSERVWPRRRRCSGHRITGNPIPLRAVRSGAADCRFHGVSPFPPGHRMKRCHVP